MNVFIFHGTMGSPEGNWFPWLKQQLINQGIEVFVPRFSTPEGQSLDNWLKTLELYRNKINQETVLVGHSMGPAFIFRILEQWNIKIKAAILAAPFDDVLGMPDFDKLIKTFIDKPFDWGKIKQNCSKFIIFAGDDDPYIPKEQTERIAKNLEVKINWIKGGRHLNAETPGYTQFPEVLAEIKKWF